MKRALNFFDRRDAFREFGVENRVDRVSQLVRDDRAVQPMRSGIENA